MTNFFRYLLISICLSCTFSAFAEDRTGHLIMTIGDTIVKADGFEDEGVAFKLGAGYQVGDYFSLEYYFIYYGEETDETGNQKISSEGKAGVLQAVGITSLTSSIRLMGKAGISKWKFKNKLEVNNTLVSRSEVSDEDLIYGAGFLFDVDEDSTVRLEYEFSKYKETDYSIISFGFQHYFGF